MMAEPVVPVQYILYTNNAVSASFTDGSQLKLSPCGTAFIHRQTPSGSQHPLQSDVTVQQRTRYATSAYRQKVQLALDFRNRFVENPFLCQELLEPCNILRFHLDIFVVQWPASVSDCSFIVYPNGSVQLNSMNNHANVCLSSHRLSFTARFLAKLSGNSQFLTSRNFRSAENSDESDSFASKFNSAEIGAQSPTLEFNKLTVSKTPEAIKPFRTDSDGSCAGAMLNTTSWDYHWNTQHHSTRDFPVYWSHPVELLRQFMQRKDYKVALRKAIRQSHEVVGKLPVESECRSSSATVVNTSLPRTLDLRCPALHLHRLNSSEVSENGLPDDGIYSAKVKAFYMKETIYRLFREQGKSLEIFPEDGSVITARLDDQMFTHLIFSDGKIEERVYSKLYPPPVSVDFSFSIPKIISTATRLLEVLSHEEMLMGTRKDPVCYESSNSSETPNILPSPLIIEECSVPDVGRFTVESNGLLHVVFTDRTCLDMMVELSAHVLPQNQSKEASRLWSRLFPEWPAGYCRLLLPNGHYHFASINNPEAPYERYVKPALDWAVWVNSPAPERRPFYSEPSENSELTKVVDMELRKIQCFSYILENSILPRTRIEMENEGIYDAEKPDVKFSLSDSSTEATFVKFNDTCISEQLKKNSEMLEDIKEFLKRNDEGKRGKLSS